MHQDQKEAKTEEKVQEEPFMKIGNAEFIKNMYQVRNLYSKSKSKEAQELVKLTDEFIYLLVNGRDDGDK